MAARREDEFAVLAADVEVRLLRVRQLEREFVLLAAARDRDANPIACDDSEELLRSRFARSFASSVDPSWVNLLDL